MNKKGFSLAEIVTAMAVLGVLILVAITSFKKENITGQAQARLAETTFAAIEQGYNYSATTKSQNNTILTLQVPKKEADGKITMIKSTNIAKDALEQYIAPNFTTFETINCNKFETFPTGFKSSGAQCANIGQNGYIALYVNKNCNSKVNAFEYPSRRTSGAVNIENACGWVAYATKKSKGVLGTDFFVAALGKKRIKYSTRERS